MKTSNDEYARTLYYEYQEMAAIPMIIAGIVFASMFIYVFFCIGDVVGYFNYKQIDATTKLIQIIIMLLFGWGLYKIHRKLMKTSDDEYARTLYYEYQEMAAIPMIIAGIVFAVMFIYSFFCMDLKQILNH